MQDVHHAIRLLKDRTGLKDLDFNAEGQIELIVENALSIYIARLDESRLELSSRLSKLDGRLDTGVMRRMLLANCLGDGTAFARLAIDQGRGGALLCQRIDVTFLEARGFEALVTDFVRHAAYWQTQGSDELLSGSAASSDSTPDDSLDPSFVRI